MRTEMPGDPGLGRKRSTADEMISSTASGVFWSSSPSDSRRVIDRRFRIKRFSRSPSSTMVERSSRDELPGAFCSRPSNVVAAAIIDDSGVFKSCDTALSRELLKRSA